MYESAHRSSGTPSRGHPVRVAQSNFKHLNLLCEPAAADRFVELCATLWYNFYLKKLFHKEHKEAQRKNPIIALAYYF